MNSQSMKSKKNMYLKKKIHDDIPRHVMNMILMWIDCYNHTISELTKISMHYEVDSKLNDTNFPTSRMKMSNSCKKAENEMSKLENDIFKWVSLLDDKKLGYYLEKICNTMDMDKNYIIKKFVINIRRENKMAPYCEYKETDKKKEEVKEEMKEEAKKEPVKEEKKLYGDAWDLL